MLRGCEGDEPVALAEAVHPREVASPLDGHVQRPRQILFLVRGPVEAFKSLKFCSCRDLRVLSFRFWTWFSAYLT